MKISGFVNFVLDYERKVYIILFMLLSLGFIYGCYFSFTDRAGDLGVLFNKSNEINIWISVVLKDAICIFVTFILGYTVIGFPFLCINVVLYGIYFGIALSEYTVQFGIKGFLIFSFAFFPYYFVFITSLIFLTFSSLRMSVALFNVFKNGTRFISPKSYSVPHIVKCLFFLFLNSVISFVFFNFIYPVINKILWKEML